jgi:hypothetical protein
MVGHLIRVSEPSAEALSNMRASLKLMTSVLIKVVETVDSWGNKKVQKTG